MGCMPGTRTQYSRLEAAISVWARSRRWPCDEARAVGADV
jgi:hypothetical protein